MNKNSKLTKVRTMLKEKGFDALLVSSIPNIIYLTNYSAFSIEEREAFLLITPTHQYIFTDTRYSEAVKKLIPHFILIERSPLETITKQIFEFTKKHSVKNLGFESNNLTALEFSVLKKVMKGIKLSPAAIIEDLRIIKTDDEIENIEKACKLGDKTFKHILNKIKTGVSEKELAWKIEKFIRENKGEISFEPIVAFGKNSAIPHHASNDRRLTTNDIILFDFGVKINNYCSDMTRTVFFGSVTAEHKKMYQTVLTAQQKAIKYISAHCHSERSEESRERKRRSFANVQDDICVLGSDVDQIARSYIINNKYPSIPHSLGHGIGIQVHESPRLSPTSKEQLKPGMVFSIEPGIYFPDFGGVRIEDLVVIEQTGPRLLTNSPKELIEL